MSVAISSKSNAETKTRAPKRRASKKKEVSEDEIRILAYSLYERRCEDGIDGDATSDWIEAKQQLLNE